jgi:hypothetical protein
VTLAATPDQGWRFDGWGSGCSGPGACVVQIAADVTVWATFVKLPSPQGGGGGGGGEPDAGGGGGGGGGGADAGGGGGSPDECAGLSPAAVGSPSASVGLSAGKHESCRTGSADGSGVVALIVDGRADIWPVRSSVFLFDSSGNSRGTYLTPSKFSHSDPFLTEQLAGFQVRNRDFRTDGGGPGDTPVEVRSEVVTIDGTGSVVGSSGTIDASFMLVAIDPLGGVVVSSVPHFLSPTRAIAAYDDRARLRWRTELPSSDAFVAIGVDREGNTLALLDGSSRYGSGKLAGIWLDHSGKAGEVFEAADLGPVPPAVVLTPRVESGLFLQRADDGRWIRQFDAFGPGQPPPSWLESRPSTTLHMARGGRAYAVISRPASAGACQAMIEVVAPSGKSCGTAVFPGEQSSLRGGSCAAGLTVGYDGTVIEKLDERSVEAGGAFTCGFCWWTGFLQ